MCAPPARLGLALAALLAPVALALGADARPLKVADALGGATPRQHRPAPPEQIPNDALVLRLDWQIGANVLLAQGGRPARDADPGMRQPASPPGSPDPKPAGDAEPSLAGIRWGLAPIRWRGLLTTDLRSFSAAGQPAAFQQVENAQFNAFSYVWQPWFAQVSGGIGGVLSSSRGDTDSRSTALTGNGALSVFPSSRFPFQASFDVSDSRASDQFVGQSYQNRRFGVRQSYRPEAGEASYAASFDRSTLSSSSFGEDTVSVFSGSHNRAFGSHRLDASANLMRSARGGSGERTASTSLYGNHGYSRDQLFTLNTLVNFGTTDQRVNPLGVPRETHTQVFQANSFFTWRREEDDPLYVTGGGRYVQIQSGLGGGVTDSSQINGFGAASYRASANLNFNANTSVTQSLSGAGGSALLTSQSGGVTYTPDPRRFEEFYYTSNLGANVSNFTGGNAGSRHALAGQAGHNITRSFDFWGTKALSLGLAQSLGVVQDSTAGGLGTLGHGANASWRLTRGESLAGFVSASANDSRNFGYNPSSFQLLNLQASGQAQIGRYSSASANLTLQGTRQQTQTSPSQGFNRTIQGGATYQHLQVFGVPQLRYLATYDRNDFQLNTRLAGNLNAPREQINSNFEQRLEYRIGKVEARLSLRLADVDGKKNALVFFRLVRQLGD